MFLLIILFGLINFMISIEVVFKRITSLVSFIPEEFEINDPPIKVISKK